MWTLNLNRWILDVNRWTLDLKRWSLDLNMYPRSEVPLLKLPEDAVQANSPIRSFLPEIFNPESSTKLFGVSRWSHFKK